MEKLWTGCHITSTFLAHYRARIHGLPSSAQLGKPKAFGFLCRRKCKTINITDSEFRNGELVDDTRLISLPKQDCSPQNNGNCRLLYVWDKWVLRTEPLKHLTYRTESVKSPGLLLLGRARKLPSTPLVSNKFSASTPVIFGWNHLYKIKKENNLKPESLFRWCHIATQISDNIKITGCNIGF